MGASQTATSKLSANGQYWLASTVIALLAIPVVPLEFGLGKIPLGTVEVALILMLAFAYTRDIRRPLDHLEIAVIALAAWAAVRLLILAPLAGEPVWWGLAARDVGVFVAAIGAYRLAQLDYMRGAIRRGLVAAFVLLVGFEVYQELFGLAWLRSFGYTTAQGFYYYTEAGSFRPFALFTGPTTFATFLAMVGIFLAFTMQNRWIALAVGVITLASVVVTETRAALLGLALVGALTVMLSARARQSVVLWVFTPLFATLLVLARPDAISGAWQRLMNATDVTDASRTSRLSLWEGVIEATSNSGKSLIGMGDVDWIQTMGPQVGQIVFAFGHAHSNFFQSWYRYGLIGVLLFTAMLAIALISTAQSVRSGRQFALGSMSACLIFAADSVFNNSLSSANFVLMLFFLLGMSTRPIGVGTDGATGAFGRTAVHRVQNLPGGSFGAVGRTAKPGRA